MSDLPRPETPDMSCPLLDKLAPETRVLICEYVLSFETPVKHATNLKPFLEKLIAGGKSNPETPAKHDTNVPPALQRLLSAKSNSEVENTGAENESGWENIEGEDDSDLPITEAETVSSLSAEAAGTPEPLCLVNTSILTTSKLIYKEAIAVCYKCNTVSIDAQFCDHEALESPQTTDLSLAAHVVTKLDLSKSAQSIKDGRFGLTESNAIHFAMVVVPAMFSNLRSSKFFLYVDAKNLFPMAATMRSTPMFSEASFDGVGSITACSSRSQDLKITVQCKEIMESWAAPTHDISVMRLHPLLATAKVLYRASRGDPQGPVAQYARSFFSATHSVLVPEVYGAIDYDTHEFWIVIDQGLNTYQRMLGVQRSSI